MIQKSILITHPEIAKDWDLSKNVALRPENFSKTSKQIISWTCQNKHSYSVSIYSRIRSLGCKICNEPAKSLNIRKNKLLKGISFAESKPELLNQWDFEKNELKPDEVSEKSHILIWFRCNENHEWQSTPQRRTRGDGCPVCSKKEHGKRVRESKLKKSGITFAEKFPDLVSEWDFNKNSLKPSELSPNSNLKVFWTCRYGHGWEATLYNRTQNKSGCPLCKSSTSKLEVFILCEFQKLFKNVKWRSKINGYECDILLPDEGFGIEVDGGYWHNDKLERDKIKTKIFKENGISLIRVRDEVLPAIEGFVIPYNKKSIYIQLVIEVLKIIQAINPSYNFNKYCEDGTQIGGKEYRKVLSLLPSPTEENSLGLVNPILSKEWDYELNNPLTPEMFTPNSEKKVWWLCKFGHSCEASIKNRHIKESGCPICYRDNMGENLRKTLLLKSGKTFASENPNLISEWDFSLNKFSPYEVAPKTNLKAWWICELGHSYEQSIAGKTKGYGCPQCSSKKRSKIARDIRINKTGTLDEIYPLIANQWDNDKNDSKANEFPPGSKEKVWWICQFGHSWKTGIYNRTIQKQGCPLCFNDNRSSLINESNLQRLGSLQDKNPNFINEWDFSKNVNISPSEVTLNSSKKIWWICEKNHSYIQSCYDRNNGHGCPICAKTKKIDSYKLKILEKRGSLKVNNPHLMQYWDFSKNLLSPDLITSGSNEIVWWKCLNNHSWQESIKKMTRSSRKTHCKQCK